MIHCKIVELKTLIGKVINHFTQLDCHTAQSIDMNLFCK